MKKLDADPAVVAWLGRRLAWERTLASLRADRSADGPSPDALLQNGSRAA